MLFSQIRKPVLLEKSGRTEQLVLPAIAGGGEALIYEVQGDPTIVAKEYKTLPMGTAHIEKIRTMFRMSPYTPGSSLPAHIKLTWPLDLMLDAQSGQPIGFIMPKFRKGMKEALKLINPKERVQNFPHVTWRNLHRIALDIASTAQLIHDTGVKYNGNLAIGDINESNIVVDTNPHGDDETTILDTDSFQVGPFPGPPPVNFRCTVGKPPYTPPELQGVRFADHDRKPEHDRFALAVFVWQLLVEGTHPFDGVFQGAGTAPTQEERIAAGHFQHGGANVPYKPMPVAPRFSILDPAIQQLFIRCFQDGHANPSARPTAQEWVDALTAVEPTLVTCAVNSQHVHSPHLQKCPWCTRAKQLKADPYPPFVAKPAPQPTTTTVVTPRTPPPPPQPKPKIYLPLTMVNCGQARVGMTNGSGTFEIRNTGNAELNLISVIASGPFQIVPLTAAQKKLAAPPPNAPATTLVVTVVFTPTATGPARGAITVKSDDPTTPSLTMSVTGEGTAWPEIAVPSTIDFGDIELGDVGTQVLTIANNGNAPLNVNKIVPPAGFAVNKTTAVVPPNSPVDITLTYTTTTVGSFQQALEIHSDDPQKQVGKVQLEVNVLQPQPPVLTRITPNWGYQGQTRLTLAIDGDNLPLNPANAHVNLGIGVVVIAIRPISKKKLEVLVNILSTAPAINKTVATTLPTAIRDVVVTNLAIPQHPAALPKAFTVIPKPELGPEVQGFSSTDLYPGSGIAVPISVAVAGTNFKKDGEAIPTVATTAPGVTLSDIAFVGAGAITGKLKIQASCPPGSYDIIITNPNGMQGVGQSMLVVNDLTAGGKMHCQKCGSVISATLTAKDDCPVCHRRNPLQSTRLKGVPSFYKQ